MAAWKQRTAFLDLLLDDAAVTGQMGEEEVRALFDYSYYLRNIGATFQRLGL